MNMGYLVVKLEKTGIVHVVSLTWYSETGKKCFLPHHKKIEAQAKSHSTIEASWTQRLATKLTSQIFGTYEEASCFVSTSSEKPQNGVMNDATTVESRVSLIAERNFSKRQRKQTKLDSGAVICDSDLERNLMTRSSTKLPAITLPPRLESQSMASSAASDVTHYSRAVHTNEQTNVADTRSLPVQLGSSVLALVPQQASGTFNISNDNHISGNNQDHLQTTSLSKTDKNFNIQLINIIKNEF